MKLTAYHEVKGILRCATGLRIGGSKDSIDIGGIDAPIIRHPVTDLPYIPGSSIKGKMRSLLELYTGKVEPDGRVHNCDDPNCLVCKYFGSLKSNSPTRFLFRDAHITETSEEMLRRIQEDKGLNFAELKNENSINRKTGRTGTGKQGGLRTFERIPAGTEFNFSLTIRLFDTDNPEEAFNFLRLGLKLLSQDYLGSSGSRGYGQIEFVNLTLNGEPFNSGEN